MNIDENKSPQTTGNPQAPDESGNMSGKELFVGLNILSKIGVVFIIIGVIAFAAVSEEYLPNAARTAMVFALGLIMIAAGEVFYRKSSKIFAGALTLGGIMELFVADIISCESFYTLNGTAAIIVGAATSAVGMLLSVRYKSQPALIITTIFSFLPFLCMFDEKSTIYVGIAYLALFQCAIVIISSLLRCKAVPLVGVGCNFIITFFVWAKAMPDKMSDTGLVYAAALTAAAYAVVSYGIYAVYACIKGIKENSPVHTVLLAFSQTAAVLQTLLITAVCTDRVTAGIFVAVLAAVYLGATLFLTYFCEIKNSVVCCFENLFLGSLFIAVYVLIIGRYAYIVIHLLAAAVYILGVVKNRKLFRVWGYVTLGAAEYIFLMISVFSSTMDIFIVQSILNAAIWLGIMFFLAARKKSSWAFTVYSWAAMLNAAYICAYLIGSRLIGRLFNDGLISINETNFYGPMFWSLVLMLFGFVSGKLKHMKESSAALSITLYAIGMIALLCANLSTAGTDGNAVMPVILSIAVNAVSVLSALDMALRIKSLAPKFARAVGLTVSAFALYTLTVVLGANGWVSFASCIISIIYLAFAAAWIAVGFVRRNALLRRFGLALALFSSAKLFLFDFSGINPMGRTLMFIGFGITLLCISFAYGYCSKKLKDSEQNRK
jgi:uncharacterized membrane protein